MVEEYFEKLVILVRSNSCINKWNPEKERKISYFEHLMGIVLQMPRAIFVFFFVFWTGKW